MRTIFLLLTLVLAGCSQVGRLRTDLSAPVPALGPEIRALQNNLAVAFVERDRDALDAIGCQALESNGSTCLMFRTDGTKAEINGYMASAFAITNTVCDDFFRATNAAALRRQNVRANVNDVGTLVTAILGFAKVGTIATSTVASATGFGDSLLRNYDTSFLVTPDLATLQPLVRAEQAQIRSSFAGHPPASFQEAHDAIILYAEPCTYLGMKRLLTRSVQLQTVVTQQGLALTADALVAAAPAVPAAPILALTPPAAAASPATSASVPVPARATPGLTAAGGDNSARVSTLLAAIARQPSPPATRWGSANGRDAWTAAALDEVRNGGKALWRDGFTPIGLETFCPGYAAKGEADRQAFWVGLLSSMARWETSGYNPTTVYRESNGELSIGVLQLSVTDSRTCPWIDEATIRQAEPNVRCGIRILARDVVRDGMIAEGTNKTTARGAARYWGPMRTVKRDDVAAWTAGQTYCRAL